MFDGCDIALENGTYMLKSSGGSENWFQLSSRLSGKKPKNLPTFNFLKFPSLTLIFLKAFPN